MIVLDCSVSASWFLVDEMSDYALAVLAAVEKDTFLVPGVWLLEMTNTILMASRRGRISSDTGREALEQMVLLPLQLAPPPPLPALRHLHDLAHRHQLSAYDAEYLRVAREASAPLATLDSRLRLAAEKEAIPLFS